MKRRRLHLPNRLLKKSLKVSSRLRQKAVGENRRNSLSVRLPGSVISTRPAKMFTAAKISIFRPTCVAGFGSFFKFFLKERFRRDLEGSFFLPCERSVRHRMSGVLFVCFVFLY